MEKVVCIFSNIFLYLKKFLFYNNYKTKKRDLLVYIAKDNMRNQEIKNKSQDDDISYQLSNLIL